VLALAGAVAAAEAPPAARLAGLRDEIARLREDARRLEGRERGLLGEIATMDGAIALHRAELEEARLRLDANEEALAARERRLADLSSSQERRKPYLVRSLRALYTRGTNGLLPALLGSLPEASARDGMRYATLLARRDASRIDAWRTASRQLAAESEALEEERSHLAATRDDAQRAADTLAASRARRADAVAKVRGDREQHERAIAELEAAAAGLSKVVPGAEGARPGGLDVRAFRGLLDWPAEGPVSAGFGPMIHPRFKTTVPHPGLDIDAPDGAPFRAVFDGRVAYAAVLHGYGMTVVIDHGQGVASVYAHAGVLEVGVGDVVARGQELGRVGDSGSLRGPYLYFELREGGKPCDPRRWLRKP